MRRIHITDATLIQFDDLSREDHTYLSPQDDCFYFIEYARRKGFNYSEANGFINNLKKSPKTRGTWQWKHKQKAISDAARTLRRQLPNNWLSESTFVPVPPSKAKGYPEYDDRMAHILAQVGNIDVRELVVQANSMEATHVSDERHSIYDLVRNYEIVEDQSEPTPTHIVILDDMITAGAHFRAMYKLLGNRFPEVAISGVFLARSVFPEKHQ